MPRYCFYFRDHGECKRTSCKFIHALPGDKKKKPESIEQWYPILSCCLLHLDNKAVSTKEFAPATPASTSHAEERRRWQKGAMSDLKSFPQRTSFSSHHVSRGLKRQEAKARNHTPRISLKWQKANNRTVMSLCRCRSPCPGGVVTWCKQLDFAKSSQLCGKSFLPLSILVEFYNFHTRSMNNVCSSRLRTPISNARWDLRTETGASVRWARPRFTLRYTCIYV